MREVARLMVRCRCGRENSPFTPTCVCGRRVEEVESRPQRSPPRAADFGPGARIGRWQLGEMLGSGAVGRVFRARADGEPGEVAVKVLHDHLAENEELRVRFGREARALSQVQHRYIGRIHEVVELTGNIALVLEAYRGRSLRAVLDERLAIGRGRVVRWLCQLCEAVGALHAHGWLHRDIKPENVFLADAGGDDAEVRLLDFGLVRSLDLTKATVATGAGMFVGSPAYAAPEQLIGAELSTATDWWSVAVVAYEALTGQRPFSGSSRTTMAAAVLRSAPPPPQLDPTLDAWLAALLDKDPRLRPASVDQVLTPLMRWSDPG